MCAKKPINTACNLHKALPSHNFWLLSPGNNLAARSAHAHSMGYTSGRLMQLYASKQQAAKCVCSCWPGTNSTAGAAPGPTGQQDRFKFCVMPCCAVGNLWCHQCIPWHRLAHNASPPGQRSLGLIHTLAGALHQGIHPPGCSSPAANAINVDWEQLTCPHADSIWLQQIR